MQLVTLTTDWGYSDHYIGVVKSKLYRTIKDCQVVDITHSIEKYNMMEGAFVVRNACLEFPKGTIHIIDIDCNEGGMNDYKHVLIVYNEQYFICTNNGMPSLIFEDLEQIKIINITKVLQDSSFYTFPALDLFCNVAALISDKTDINEFGEQETELVKRNIFTPTIYSDLMLCTVFHIDSYGNVFLNITINEFQKGLGKKHFSIKMDRYNITKISSSYDNVKENNPLLTVASTGHMQIAINKANASELFGLKYGSQITIQLNDKKQ